MRYEKIFGDFLRILFCNSKPGFICYQYHPRVAWLDKNFKENMVSLRNNRYGFIKYLDSNDANAQVLDDVSEILTGFFKIGLASNNENKLHLYSDDGNIVEYTGKF